jgi:hypothetical protein
MARDIVRSPAETLGDFSTDATPSLFIDNWGRDVVAEHGDRLKAPIDAAVALAQLMSSIRSGEPIDRQTLDPEVLSGVAFVDGSDGKYDHFFSIGLRPLSRGGSYDGPRVAAKFMSGYAKLEPSEGELAHYDERWSTLRGDVLPGRDPQLFDEDLRRISNALSVLEGATEADLSAMRPDSWPNQPSDTEPNRDILTALSVAETPVYVGENPLEGVFTESDRKIHIPALDGPPIPGGVQSLPTPSSIGEALVLFATVDLAHQEPSSP